MARVAAAAALSYRTLRCYGFWELPQSDRRGLLLSSHLVWGGWRAPHATTTALSVYLPGAYFCLGANGLAVEALWPEPTQADTVAGLHYLRLFAFLISALLFDICGPAFPIVETGQHRP